MAGTNRTAGAALVCGLIGGVVGLGIGGAIGPVLAGIDMPSDPKNPFELFNACFGSFFMLVGAGVGGIVGGIAGATFGATLVAQEDAELQAERNAPPANTNAELDRLRQRVAELEEQVEDKDSSSVDSRDDDPDRV